MALVRHMDSEHYILMADIIGSSRFEGKADELMASFKKVVTSVNRAHEDRLLSPLTITLGDEFQGIPDSLATAGLIVIALEEQRVLEGVSFRLRYVIHHGLVETPINEVLAHGMLGPGLTSARRSLSTFGKKNKDRVRLSLAAGDPTRAIEDVFRILFTFIDDWKKKDMPVVAAWLEGLDTEEAARRLGRHRTSMGRRYGSLKLDAYAAARRLLTHLTGGESDTRVG